MSSPAAAPPAIVNPLVEAILSGKAPLPVRMAAARGALPVTRGERLLLCVKLLGDSEAEVRQSADQRLAAGGSADVTAMLQAGEDPAAEVLDHFARRPDLPVDLLEILVLHPDLSSAALQEVAGCPHPSVLERIVINQTRLLADPEIVRRLDANPKLGPTGQRLLVEFKHDFWEKSGQKLVLSRPEEASPAASPAGPVAAGEAAVAETAEAGPVELLPEEAADEAFKAAYVRIMALSVPQKIMLTIRATREERAILVRDSNRLVASAVLKSPKLSDQEVEKIANMRNVSDEVLRLVAANKTWTRTYAVIHALCRNPKTPVGMTLPFLNRLNIRDLKNLSGDKNITDALRKMCKRTFELRDQANKPAFKKK